MGNHLANTKHNIFLTYCHEIVGVAMKWLVQEYFPSSAISEAQSFQKALSDLPNRPYDLVVLDAEIGDGAHVMGAVEHIKAISPKTRILIFSELDETVYGPKYLAFGTNGYLAKKADINRIVLAIGTALDGGVFDGSRESERSISQKEDFKQNPFERLSRREAQIAQILIQGWSLTDISKLTGLKETTISTYKKRIFRKIGVPTLSDLIALSRVYS